MITEYYRHKCAVQYHYYRCSSCGRKANRHNPIATDTGECLDCLRGILEDRQEWDAYQLQLQEEKADAA
jgi:hypothetical protein